MSDTKISPEWCEDMAAFTFASLDALPFRARHVSDVAQEKRLLIEALRLAARALKAREWAEEQMVSLASRDHHDNFTAGQECAVTDLLAILDGRGP